MDDLHARTVAELHRLLHEREGSGDESLRRDNSGDRRESDQGILHRTGREQVERIDRSRGIAQNQRALTEVVRKQCRQHQEEPGEPDGTLAEMSHIGVERFGSRDSEDYSAEENESGVAMLQEKAQPVPRICRGKDLWRLQNFMQSKYPNRREPHDHYRPEDPPDLRGPMLLEK